MSKMKHLLRKLHIGSGHMNNSHDHRIVGTTQPVPTSSSTSPDTSSSSTGRIVAGESVGADRAADAGRSSTPTGESGGGFSFFEEDYQMQMALSMSASDPHAREDPESAQINAAKKISLGRSSVVSADTNPIVESLSLRYCSYNVVNYDEKIVDGFYDVYGVTSNSFVQGKIPSLGELQAIPILDNVDNEVILVNRLIDPELRELEKRAYIIYMGNRARQGQGLVLSDLIQKISEIVVDRMGGAVGDADEMSGRWNWRCKVLQNARSSIILPLGCLDVGLSRHRALLFKVLADAINLPCLLVKGSYYTGTDDGAVNLIKIDNGSEFIIDLMGAPGTLIPPEVPSNHLINSGVDMRGFIGFVQTPSSLLLEDRPRNPAISPNPDRLSQAGSAMSEERILVGNKTCMGGMNLAEKKQMLGFEDELGKLFSSSKKSSESSSAIRSSTSPQNIKVKDVSKYVLSAAKDPEFAQKLHAVLLESGASPPPDLFSDVDMGEPKLLQAAHVAAKANLYNKIRRHSDYFLPMNGQPFDSLGREESVNNIVCGFGQEQVVEGTAQQGRELEANILKFEPFFLSNISNEGFIDVDDRANENLQTNAAGLDMVPVNAPGVSVSSVHENQAHESSLPYVIDSCQSQPECSLVSDYNKCFQEKVGNITNMERGNDSAMKLRGSPDSSQLSDYNSHSERINPMLGEVAEWKIAWEELQIGERIGIGSYGEVYHADWNGTEVAVKKFLDQGFTGDALVQFKCEAEIMIRLRHPNVVLFMGAVTRPPNLSILTEYLPRGSLYRLLHRPNSQVDEKRRMRMAVDVAKGMNYLHTSHPTIVHRDLKSPNLLVDKSWVVKVCDFGLSRIKNHTFLSSKSTAGTPEWMAPEVLRNEPANEKCDVYSFGVILWELATCEIPWKGLNPMQVVGAVGFQNRHLEIPESINPAITQIINDCWQMEPNLRPSFSQLIPRLRRVQHLLVERASHTDKTAGVAGPLLPKQ